MFTKSQLLAAVSLITVASARVADDKPTISPGTSYDKVESGLRNNLKPMHSNWDYWGAGWIPKGCKDLATSKNLNPYDFTVFNVHYDDCSEPWIFCRHRNSGASEIDMIDMFGRMPAHMRSYVRQFIATPGLGDGAAGVWYYPGDIMVEDRPTANLLVHEMSHGLDYMALKNFGSPFSETDAWNNEYAKDSSVPTDYSRVSFVENFAEVGVVAVYDKVVPGGLGAIQSNWNAIFHQYATYQGYLGDNIIPGGSCRNRVPNSETVPMGNSAKARRGLGPKPDTSFKNASIAIVEIDDHFKGVFHAHLHHDH